jgi:hypothetical protein
VFGREVGHAAHDQRERTQYDEDQANNRKGTHDSVSAVTELLLSTHLPRGSTDGGAANPAQVNSRRGLTVFRCVRVENALPATKYFVFLSPTSARFPTYILDGRCLACFAACANQSTHFGEAVASAALPHVVRGSPWPYKPAINATQLLLSLPDTLVHHGEDRDGPET